MKATVLAAKEKELIDRAEKLAARKAEVEALKGSVIDEGSGIAEGLVQTQRQQERRDREQSAREQTLTDQLQEAQALVEQERQRIQDHAQQVAL